MKVKLITKKENYTKLKQMLEKGGFEVSNDADLILKDNNEQSFFLGDIDHEMIPIPYKDIIYIESFGRDIYINTINSFMKLNHRLYEVE